MVQPNMGIDIEENLKKQKTDFLRKQHVLNEIISNAEKVLIADAQ